MHGTELGTKKNCEFIAVKTKNYEIRTSSGERPVLVLGCSCNIEALALRRTFSLTLPDWDWRS